MRVKRKLPCSVSFLHRPRRAAGTRRIFDSDFVVISAENSFVAAFDMRQAAHEYPGIIYIMRNAPYQRRFLIDE